MLRAGRGDAAAATRTFRGNGCDVDIPRRRLRRGHSAATAATRTFRGDGCDADIPRRRLRRGHSAATAATWTFRGDAAAARWKFRDRLRYAGAAANKLLVEVASLDALSAATGAGPADYASVVLTASDGADRVAARVARGGADDGLAAAVATLGFYWMSRSKRDGERPLAVDFDGAALSLVLAPPPTPKFGGRKRRSLPRLPTVAVTFAAAR